METGISGYSYEDAELNCSHRYLLPELKEILSQTQSKSRIFDLGCGNGSISNELNKMGYDVTGIDQSPYGIEQALQKYPNLKLYNGSVYDDLSAKYGKFPIVICLEVVEHVFFPRKFASTLYDLTESGGWAIVSTPYHGYFKNLVMALTGKMDNHFTALWDNGHIKFWSIKTLRILLEEAGFNHLIFRRVGRIAALAKSMIAIAKK
jgi:2-polyprenyl-6-hydroxyphenyl methylase/3-demethylubiquinone-9 3-methyltransferase